MLLQGSYPGLAEVNKMNERLHITFDSARTLDENGFLHVKSSHITKATVNPYLGREIPGWQEQHLEPDKIYYAFRAPDELRKSLNTWSGLPLQLEHHLEGADEAQAKFTRVGTVGTVVQWNEPYIDAPLTIWDKDAIEMVKDGSCRELSCAYAYEPDFTPGTYQGEPYDFVMRNIRGNHVALVPEGRAGHDVIVADCQLNSHGDLNMRRKLARDENPAVEEKELQLGAAIEQAGKELQNLHEEKEAAPVDKEPAADSDLEELKAKYKLDDAALAEIKAALMGGQDCGTAAADEEEPAAEDEDEPAAEGEEQPAQDEEDVIRDAMTECGLDPENEGLRGAFASGMQFGEREGQPVPPPPAPAPEDLKGEIKHAEDRAFRRAVKFMKDEYKSRAKAADKVAPLVGKLDHMSFDSAASIYGYALRRQGVSLTGRSQADYEALLDGYMAARFPRVKRASRAAAMDAKPADNVGKFLNNIRIED